MDSSQDSTTRPDRVRAFFGVGSVATAALELCRQRPWMDVVGAVRGPASAAGARPPIPAAWTGVCIREDPDAMLDEVRSGVVLVATRSPLDAVLPLIERCAERGVHVICSNEELVWPDVERPESPHV